MAPVRPLGDRILVSVIGRERVTAGGIVLPENIREESDRGEVVAVGPGRVEVVQGSQEYPPQVFDVPIAIEVGDVVVFSPYAGTRVEVGMESFLLLREGDILGVLEVKTDDEGVQAIETESLLGRS